MFETTVDSVGTASAEKLAFLRKNPVGYFVASVMAGLFISFGSFVAMSAGGYCSPWMGVASKLPLSIAFSAALSLVIMAGCELFTGNNLVVGLGALVGRNSWRACFGLWTCCWVGNLVGSWVGVLLFHYAGADSPAPVAATFAGVSAAKCGYSVLQLVLRGVLCNILVCLAVWCAARLKDETAKLIMVFWCILVFMVCGFEHSIANMSIIGVALFNPSATGVTVAAYANNVIWVTVGNVIGGFVFVAMPYVIMAKSNDVGKQGG